MLSLFLCLLSGALGAFFYRARGGFNPLDLGTTVARLLFWAFPASLANIAIVAARGGTLWETLGLGFLAYVLTYVSLLEDQSNAISNDKPLTSMGEMAQIGAMRAAAIALPCAVFAPWMVLLPFFGALAGPAYFFGWCWLDGVDSGITWRGRIFAKGGSEWGEVLTGAAFGLGIGLLGCL